MRIAVNTRFLIKNKLSGLGHFTLEVMKHMVTGHPEDTFIFIFDRPYDASFIFASNIEAVVIPPPARASLLFAVWFEISIPSVLRRVRADVFLSPDNFLSLRTSVPTVLVIHDLAYIHTGRDIPFLQRLYYGYFMPRYARRADHIATVSEATKADIIRQFGIADKKISVTGLGLNEGFRLEDGPAREDYFVHLGTIQPRKNVVRVLRAFEIFKRKTGRPTRLLFIGGRGWKDKEFYSVLSGLSCRNDVEMLGYRSNDEISYILNRASALLCVSYFEGFGMPIIEAQQCGCPVITSDISSMPEASGGAALLVDPYDTSAIARAMETIIADEILREELIRSGLENIRRFSWQKTSDSLYHLLQKVSGRQP